MGRAMAVLGDSLRTLPDGKTGERFHWIIHVIEALRAHPDLELRRDGDWSDHDRTPVFRGAQGPPVDGRRARPRTRGDAVVFQVEVPVELVMAARAPRALQPLAARL